MKPRHCHKGGALISALFITAIVAMLATALAISQRYLVNNAQLILRGDALYLQLQGEQFNAENNIKNYVAQWMEVLSSGARLQPLKNTVNTVIEDEQGKYNLNNLIYSANQPGFVALLQAVVPTLSKETALNIAKSITAWETTGSQDPYYLSLHPAYRSSKTEMANISELRLIAGVTPEIYSALAPYITALPIAKPSLAQKINVMTPINVNSASAPVLMTLDPTISLSVAQQLIFCRESYGVFFQPTDFISACAQRVGITTLNNMTTQSHYFLVTSEMQYQGQGVFLKSLLVTQFAKNNKLEMRVVWQGLE